MKHSFSIFILLICITPPLTAQDREIGIENFESLRVLDMNLPRYPQRMTFEGIYNGQATLVISVDESGSIIDVFQESYSHPEFGRLAEKSLRTWIFQSAKLNGEPVVSIKPFIFNFDDKRGVFSVGMQEAAASFLKIDRSSESKRLYNVDDLDNGLKPDVMGQPFSPEEFKGRSIDGNATVIFYVDEEGKTRMPHLEDYSHPSFGKAALNAVDHWKFKVSTVKGRPVSIQLRQTFIFSNKSS